MFEQHVRWIHIPDRDFGTSPIPSLMMLLTYGVIRADEFASFAADVLQEEIDKLPPPHPARIRRGLRYGRVAFVAHVVTVGAIVTSMYESRVVAVLILLPAILGVSVVHHMVGKTFRAMLPDDDDA